MKRRIEFEFMITYLCNIACKDCMRFLDRVRWDDKAWVTAKDVEIAGNILKSHGIEIGKVKISGGEPSTCPDFDLAYQALKEHWNPIRLPIFTNGYKPLPKKYRSVWRSDPSGKDYHKPTAISPIDLGMEPVLGVNPKRPCRLQTKCGVGFSPYGFMSCGQVGYLGRILGIDPHKIEPVLHGDYDLCKHCFFSLGRRDFWKVVKSIKDGEIEHPTKTYVEGFKRAANEPYPKLFQDRL